MDHPNLVRVESNRGRSEALVILRGYLSEKGFVKNKQFWIDAIRQAGWKGSIYHLWWESPGNSAWNRICIHRRWKRVKKRAERVGKYHLSSMISTLPEKSISLIGYSLGARVIYDGLAHLSDCPKPVDDVILLGGSVRRNKEWGIRASGLRGHLINIYNSDDEILDLIFKVGELYLRSPCGLKPIEDRHPKIININATSLMGTSSHKERHYLSILPQTVGRRYW
jgi:hypothetical protein